MISIERGVLGPPHTQTLRLRIVAGAIRSMGTIPALTFDWLDDAPIAMQTVGGQSTRVPLKAAFGGWTTELQLAQMVPGQSGRLTVVFGMSPWHALPRLAELARAGKHVVYVPYHGWHAGIWHDGPIVHLVDDGRVVSMVPRGEPVRLLVPFQSNTRQSGLKLPDAEKWLRDAEEVAVRASLVAAVKERLGRLVERGFAVHAPQFDSVDAVLLVLARMAAPRVDVELVELPDDDEQLIGWRRLAQNLGIVHGKAPRRLSDPKVLELAELRSLVPESLVATVASYLNGPSDVIPVRLLR